MILATVTAWWLQRGSDQGLHPRRPQTVFGLESLTPQQTSFTVITISIYAAGKDVEILGLRPVTTPNVAYLGAITVWPRNEGDSAVDGGPGFPERGILHYHPAIGVVIPASETSYLYPGESTPRELRVNAGFRLTSGDIGAVNDVEVTYRVGDKRHREHSRVAIIACMKPCKQSDPEQEIFDWEHAVLAQFGMKETDS